MAVIFVLENSRDPALKIGSRLEEVFGGQCLYQRALRQIFREFALLRQIQRPLEKIGSQPGDRRREGLDPRRLGKKRLAHLIGNGMFRTLVHKPVPSTDPNFPAPSSS